jgi:hypothetical protein
VLRAWWERRRAERLAYMVEQSAGDETEAGKEFLRERLKNHVKEYREDLATDGMSQPCQM